MAMRTSLAALIRLAAVGVRGAVVPTLSPTDGDKGGAPTEV
jgi:hypothetical protein